MTNNQKLYIGLGVAAVLVYVNRDKIFGKKKGTTVTEPVVNPAITSITPKKTQEEEWTEAYQSKYKFGEGAKIGDKITTSYGTWEYQEKKICCPEKTVARFFKVS